MTLALPSTVYVDESSSTGENLLDLEQPVFSLSGICLEDSVAADLVATVVRQLPANHGEPKYSILGRNRRGRSALVECLSALPHRAARFYLVHKRFMIETKMVDLLIEPMAYEDGYNMYEDGSALGLANLLHMVGPVLGDQLAYDRMLSLFVKALRGRQLATVDELFAAIRGYYETCSTDLRDVVSLFLATRPQAERITSGIADRTSRDHLDPAIPCLVALAQDMGQQLGPFRLIHDRSYVVARHALTLLNMNKLPNPTRHGSRLSPLPAVVIDFADSKEIPQLQLADWVAGAGRQWATHLVRRNEDPFAEQLGPIIGDWRIGALWPDPDRISNARPMIIE